MPAMPAIVDLTATDPSEMGRAASSSVPIPLPQSSQLSHETENRGQKRRRIPFDVTNMTYEQYCAK